MDFGKVEEGYADGEQPLHFYYNREERIKNAPKIVQDYYAGKIEFSRNPFKVMFKNKMNRFMFIFLFVFSAFAYFMNYQSAKASCRIAGTIVKGDAFSYAEEVYVSVELKELKEKDKVSYGQKAVSVKFTAFNAEGEACDSFEGQDVYDGSGLFIRTKFNDYDIIKIVADVTVGDENKSFSARVVKR